MSRVADARKLLQDFMAPELCAGAEKLDSSEKLATERHAALIKKLGFTHVELGLKLELVSTNRRIEELQSKQQGTASQ